MLTGMDRTVPAASSLPMDPEHPPWIHALRSGLFDLLELAGGIRGLRHRHGAAAIDGAIAEILEDAIACLSAAIVRLQRAANSQATCSGCRWVNLEQLIAAALLTCVPAADSRPIGLDLAEGCGVVTDPIILHHVLACLLRQACADAGCDGLISVSLRPTPSGGACIRISTRAPDDRLPAIDTRPPRSAMDAGLGLYAAHHLLGTLLGGHLLMICADGLVTAVIGLPGEPPPVDAD